MHLLSKSIAEETSSIFETCKNNFKHKIILVNAKRDEILFKENTSARYIYYINSGVIKTCKKLKNNEQAILEVFSTGDFLNLGHSKDYRIHCHSAVVMQDSLLSKIPKETFQQFLLESPALMERVLSACCYYRSQLLTSYLSTFQSSVRERSAMLLLKLDQKFGIKRSNQHIINLVLTRAEMASMIGTAKETMARTLNSFKEERILEFSDKKIVLLDIKKLKDLSTHKLIS